MRKGNRHVMSDLKKGTSDDSEGIKKQICSFCSIFKVKMLINQDWSILKCKITDKCRRTGNELTLMQKGSTGEAIQEIRCSGCL